MTNMTNTTERPGKMRQFTQAINRFIAHIRELFSLEEVEVTFTKVGDSTRYSYTKVDHEHA